MAVEFRDGWFEAFYEDDQSHKKIPNNIEGAFNSIANLREATLVENRRNYS